MSDAAFQYLVTRESWVEPRTTNYDQTLSPL